MYIIDMCLLSCQAYVFLIFFLDEELEPWGKSRRFRIVMEMLNFIISCL